MVSHSPMRELILNQLVYFAFLQSVFLLGIYVFSTRLRRHINAYLLVLILVILIGLMGKVGYSLELLGGGFRWFGLSEYATFLFGASVYLFTRSSLLGKRFAARDLVHYLPGIVYIVMITFYYLLPPNAVINARLESGELFRAVVLFMGLGLLFNITYWVMSYRKFLAFRAHLSDEVSYAVKTRFFSHFLITVGLCLFCWLAIYLIGAFGHSWLERTVRPFIWLSLAFIVLFISYYGIKEPELFKIAPLISPKKYAQSKLSAGDLDVLKAKLDQLMEEKKPFLNRNLLKADLAELLEVNNPEVSRLLNERIGMNFFEYINYHRIKEFISLAQQEGAQRLTFFGLAQEAGFNSKTTFNKSFKKIMGTSPKDYFEKEMG